MNLDEFEGHTPGPWVAKHDLVETEAKYGHRQIINSDGWRVWLGESADINDEPRDDIVDTTLVENSRFCGKKLGEADAKLIAAAPLLLDMLNELLEECRMHYWCYESENDDDVCARCGGNNEHKEWCDLSDALKELIE